MKDYMSVHHLWFPRRWYRSQLEQDFRELCPSKVELPRFTHDLIHRYQPEPAVPTRGDMIHAIILHMETCIQCNVRLRRRAYLKPGRTP